MRTFIAVNLPEEIKKEIEAVIKILRKSLGNLKNKFNSYLVFEVYLLI